MAQISRDPRTSKETIGMLASHLMVEGATFHAYKMLGTSLTQPDGSHVDIDRCVKRAFNEFKELYEAGLEGFARKDTVDLDLVARCIESNTRNRGELIRNLNFLAIHLVSTTSLEDGHLPIRKLDQEIEEYLENRKHQN